jgi:hypothetical protein
VPAQQECIGDKVTEAANWPSQHNISNVIEVDTSEMAAVKEELLKVDARALFTELFGGDILRTLVHYGLKRRGR